MFGDRGDQWNPSEPEELYRRLRDDFYYRAGAQPIPLTSPGQTGASAHGGWIPLPIHLRPFELYDDITPGGTDKYAWILKEDTGALVRDESADKIKVSDLVLKNVRAYGTSHTGFTDGARGWYWPKLGKNMIVECQRLAKICYCTTVSTVHSWTDPFSVHNVTPMDDGQSPVASNTDTLSVANWPGWTAAAEGKCIIAQDGSGWRFVQGQCG